MSKFLKITAGFFFLVFLGIVFIFCLYLIPGGDSQYIPTFKKSKLELVTGDGFPKPKLFYQTNSPAKIGDSVDQLQMISVVAQEHPGTADTFRVSHHDNLVDAVMPGYVVFEVNAVNFDCFAIYTHGQLTRYEQIDFSRLPTPSDAWICKGYDFKKAPSQQ